jgi:hypothetical protein
MSQNRIVPATRAAGGDYPARPAQSRIDICIACIEVGNPGPCVWFSGVQALENPPGTKGCLQSCQHSMLYAMPDKCTCQSEVSSRLDSCSFCARCGRPAAASAAHAARVSGLWLPRESIRSKGDAKLRLCIPRPALKDCRSSARRTLQHSRWTFSWITFWKGILRSARHELGERLLSAMLVSLTMCAPHSLVSVACRMAPCAVLGSTWA